MKMKYGVADFLAAEGYAQGTGKNLLKAFEEWKRRNPQH